MDFCTLFDSNYIDKGIALVKSINRVSDDVTLYVLATDEKCYNMLSILNFKNVVLISLNEFESEELLNVKKDRTIAEYCWTCTPAIIDYVIEHYSVDSCTYIDSDLYFFDNPQILFDEMNENNASVMITEHRFEDSEAGMAATKKNGKYCVQFNTFKNNEEGIVVLKWWKAKCIEWCFFKHEENRMGDQKYLECWTRDFSGVHELKNLGGGVAPWNVGQYNLDRIEKEKIWMADKKNNSFNLIFYHFQNIRYISRTTVNLRSQCKDVSLKLAIYIPYLKEIEEIRAMLIKEFGYEVSIQKSCSGNPFVAFVQKHIMKYKLVDLTDLINLNKLEKYQMEK